MDQHYVIPRENHNPIEMHATIAAWEGERLTLWDKTQWVNNAADEIAAVFGISAQNVRVVSPFVGGAFGSALRTWPHVTLAALGARVAKRPVKLMLSRREMYYGVGYRPHTVQRVALGASRDGRLAAIPHEGYQETSTYEEFSEALLNATRFLHSCPNVHTRHRIARMNVHTPTYMRAPGRGERHLRARIRHRRTRRGAEPRSRWNCACATSRSRTSSRSFPSRAARPGNAIEPLRNASAGAGATRSRARCEKAVG